MKEIDIRNASLEETIKAYKNVSDDLKLQAMIWEKTHNVEKATKVYKKVKENIKSINDDVSSKNGNKPC